MLTMSVDWSKPLESLDGRPARLLRADETPGGVNPDHDGDYWVALHYGRKRCVRPCGRATGANEFAPPLVRNVGGDEGDDD